MSSVTIRRRRPTSSICSHGDGTSSRGSPTDQTLTFVSTPSSQAKTFDTLNQEANERFFPYVIEPAAGATRTTFAFLIDAYREETVNDEPRSVLSLHNRLAPYKVAVLPLSKKAELIEPAEKIAAELRKRWMIELDITQSIGRRYRRQDEIGTPYCVTFDFDSLDDDSVTVRDRDTMQQERISSARLVQYLG